MPIDRRATHARNGEKIRLDVRIAPSFSQHEAKVIEAAAKIKGYSSLSAWIAEVAIREAKQVVSDALKNRKADKGKGLLP